MAYLDPMMAGWLLLFTWADIEQNCRLGTGSTEVKDKTAGWPVNVV